MIPPFTRLAKARKDARAKAPKLPPDGPEALRWNERCLPDAAGPPLIPTAYNNFIQIVQTADHVIIESEMIHADARGRGVAAVRVFSDGSSRVHEQPVVKVETGC